MNYSTGISVEDMEVVITLEETRRETEETRRAAEETRRTAEETKDLLRTMMRTGSSGSSNLGDDEKRWFVFGICLHKILIPALRDFVEPEMIKYYTFLRTTHNIDKQSHAKHLLKDGMFNLYYGNINNNEATHKRKTHLYDYDVKSAVDLTKLYLPYFLTKFTGFDDTFTTSAVLGILSSASVFSSAVQWLSSDVRQDVKKWRNGYPGQSGWNETKFSKCIQQMETLVRALTLSPAEKKRITDELRDWETKGSSGLSNLGDDEKRWFAVGICLNKILLPALRDFVEPEMIKHYAHLRTTHNIDKQSHAKHLPKDGMFNLNYGNINNNHAAHGKETHLYDYDVKSAVDLTKLYWPYFLTRFTGSDTYTSSAVYYTLSSASVFSSAVQRLSSDVMNDVRNEWRNGNFGHWNGKRLAKCIQQMESLVRALTLSPAEEKRITDELQDWKAKEDTIPTEIFARGPEALKAYKEALQSGKTKHRRLLVMVVGPARVGKTSLLKSLNGEEFDPKEDSTDGIQLQHTFCKPQENCWSKDSDEGISYTDCMADVIHENLRGKNDENIAEATKEPIEKSVESSETLQKNDYDGYDVVYGNDDNDNDDDDDDDDDDKTKSSKAESLNEEIAIKMEKQEYISWDGSRNLPKAIKEKLLVKLKDTESDKTKANELYIKTLDFAGQDVYNVIHPIFLTSKAVFILVYNLKNILHCPMKSKAEKHGLERELVDPFEMTNLENLELWLSCISSYTDAERRAKVDELSLPPVLIVGTHADEFDGNLEAAKQIIREIYKCLSPSKNLSGCHVKRDEIYTVNNSTSGNGEIRDESVRKLKADIEELSNSLPHMKEDIPVNWLLFEEELSNLVEKENKKYITIDEAMKTANKCKVNTSAESKEFTTLLNYLHDLKTIIYFEEINIVFIDTQWLVKVFTKVIEVRVAEKRGGFDKFWDKLEEEGVLERALVEHVWKGLVDEQNTIDSLLLIMEKFSLICRWNTSEGKEVYLVPCMLCNSRTRDDIAMFLRHQKTATMVIRFNTSHVSLGIFPRLFVAIAEEGKKEWPNLRQPKLCKNFCRIFNVGKETNLDICVIQSTIRTISVTVCNKQNIDGQRVTEFCQHFRKLLDQIFDGMRQNFPWMQSMKFEYGILCPVCESSPKNCKCHGMEGCTRDSCLHFVNEEELILDRPECCEDVAHLDNVIKEEAYSHWFPKKVVGSTLTENQKRWLVIGICLNIVLLPPVRKFLEPNILNHYTNLKASNHIDNQVHGGHLVNDGKCRALNYRSINNNITINGARNYDYNVTSAVDLAKLYLQPHMAKFTGFDNTCDLSAVLGILSTASVFSSDVQDFSSKVRGEVRNEWGHCNVQSWDETKFADCFKLMHSLLKALTLSSDDEKTIADQLTDWENKGVEIRMANKVQPELVKDIEDKVTQLSLEFQLAFSRNEENIGQLSEDVEHLALHQKEVCRVLDTLVVVQDAVQTLKRRMGLVEERVGKVEEKVGKIEVKVGRVDEKYDCLDDRVKVLEARELKKC